MHNFLKRSRIDWKWKIRDNDSHIRAFQADEWYIIEEEEDERNDGGITVSRSSAIEQKPI